MHRAQVSINSKSSKFQGELQRFRVYENKSRDGLLSRWGKSCVSIDSMRLYLHTDCTNWVTVIDTFNGPPWGFDRIFTALLTREMARLFWDKRVGAMCFPSALLTCYGVWEGKDYVRKCLENVWIKLNEMQFSVAQLLLQICGFGHKTLWRRPQFKISVSWIRPGKAGPHDSKRPLWLLQPTGWHRSEKVRKQKMALLVRQDDRWIPENSTYRHKTINAPKNPYTPFTK